MRKLYTRSPIFVQSSTGTDVEVGVRIWTGGLSDIPSTNTYTLNKAHNSNGKATFEVSDLLSDYIEHSFSGTYYSGATYVRFYVIETGGSTYNSETLLALDGYTEGDTVQYITQSEYNIASDDILMTVGTLATPEDTTTVVPTQGATRVMFFKDDVLKFTKKLNAVNLVESNQSIVDFSALSGSTIRTDSAELSPAGVMNASTIELASTTPLLRLYTSYPYTSNRHSVRIFVKAITGTPSFYFGLTDTEVNVTTTSEWQEVVLDDITPTNFGLNLFIDILVAGNVGDKVAVYGLVMNEGSESTSYSDTPSTEVEYSTSAGQSASTFYARVLLDGGTIVDEHCSDDIMEYVTELDIDKIHVVKSDGSVEVIEVEQLPCNKYENSKLTFVNKFGALQDIHFSAKNSKSYKFKGEEYKSHSFDYDNLSNNYGQHSKTPFNKNGETMHKLNTDYLPESYSEYFKELLMSERVWMEHKGAVVPVNVSKSSLEHKTHVNNGLIQFEITVTESHNIATNIR